MSYGIKVLNRGGDTLIGSTNLSLKYVSTGVVLPEFEEVVSGEAWPNLYAPVVKNAHSIPYPSNINKNNAFIFAKPEVTVLPADGGDDFDVLREGTWPMGVRFDTTGFTIIAPHQKSVKAQLLNETKKYSNNYSMYGLDNIVAPVMRTKIRWQLWTVGNAEEEDDTGVQIKTANGDIIYTSNRKTFRVESSSYSDCGIDWDPGDHWAVATNPIKLYMEKTSAGAQMEYYAFLNGTAHTCGLAKGGRIHTGDSDISELFYTSPIMAPISNSFAQNFVTWHYYDSEDLYNRKPYVEWGGRLAYWRSRSGNLESPSVEHLKRVGNNLGVKTLAMIGVIK